MPGRWSPHQPRSSPAPLRLGTPHKTSIAATKMSYGLMNAAPSLQKVTGTAPTSRRMLRHADDVDPSLSLTIEWLHPTNQQQEMHRKESTFSHVQGPQQAETNRLYTAVNWIQSSSHQAAECPLNHSNGSALHLHVDTWCLR